MEAYTCANVKFEYIESMKYDSYELKQWYWDNKVFTATCRIMPWANSSLRVLNFMAIGPHIDKFSGKLYKIIVDDTIKNQD